MIDEKGQVLGESGVSSRHHFIVVHGLDIVIEGVLGFLNRFEAIRGSDTRRDRCDISE